MSASAGKVLLTPKGDYNASTTYSILDWVRYNGAVYVAKQTTTGNLPTDTTYWSLMLNAPDNLTDLTDVDIDTTTLADGQTLVYNATTGKFENGESSGGVGKDLTGQTVEPESGTTVTAGYHAEIFNDYSQRTYVSGAIQQGNVASGLHSHAEGSRTTASNTYAHAEGVVTIASGDSAHAEGYHTTASGAYSHAEGAGTTASSSDSHAEGANTTASGNDSHAEGSGTTASGVHSHAEGYQTTADGIGAHAEGYATRASGRAHAGGFNVDIHGGQNAFAHGQYIASTGNDVVIFGKGRSDKTLNGNSDGITHGNWEKDKFNNISTLPTHGTGFTVAFSNTGSAYASSKTNILQLGGSGYIYNGAYTATLTLEYQAMYLLFVNSIDATTGAQRGSGCYMVVGAGSESNTTPALVSLGTTGTPASVTAVSDNYIKIKNESATYCTQFTLIRVA